MGLLDAGNQSHRVLRDTGSANARGTTYNERTLDLFHHNPETRVIVASVAFGLGMNIRIITDSINLGIPDTVEALVQQNGRAGRDLEMDAHGWTYIESAVVLSVREDLDEGAVVGFEDGILPKKKKARSKGRSRRVVEAKMKRLVSAHLQGLCIIAELNVILGNPGVNTELSCEAAGRRLPCSSCQPFWNNPAPAPMPPGYVVPVTPLSASSRRPRSLTKKQRAHAHAHLMYFAEKRTLVKDTACSRYAPTAEFWTGTNLDLILDNLHLLNAKEGLDAMLSKWQYLTDDGNMLHLLINGLNAQYDALYLKAKATQARRAAATRAAKKATQEKENVPPTAEPMPTSKPARFTIRIPARQSALTSCSIGNAADFTGNSCLSPEWEPPPVASLSVPVRLPASKHLLDTSKHSQSSNKRQRRL